jgi:hypothetical protein
VYNPEHPLVLEAAGKLIETPNQTGEYYDAERFARICYEARTRPPLDSENFEAAEAPCSLACAFYELIRANGSESADVEEAEMLARKAVLVMKELKGLGSDYVGWSFGVLTLVLRFKKDYGDETKKMLEDYFSDAIRYQGKDGDMTASAHDHLGHFHHDIIDTLSCNVAKRKHLHLAESHYKEVIRLCTKLLWPDSRNTLEAVLDLSAVSRALEQLKCE